MLKNTYLCYYNDMIYKNVFVRNGKKKLYRKVIEGERSCLGQLGGCTEADVDSPPPLHRPRSPPGTSIQSCHAVQYRNV